MFILQQFLKQQLFQLCNYNWHEGAREVVDVVQPPASEHSPLAADDVARACSDAAWDAQRDWAEFDACEAVLDPEIGTEWTWDQPIEWRELGEEEWGVISPDTVDEDGNIDNEWTIDALIQEKEGHFNPEEAQRFTDALEELRQREWFDELTPEQLQAEIDNILNRITNELWEAAETELAEVEREIQDPSTTPERRRELEWQRTWLNDRVTFHRWNPDWQQLPTPERDSSWRYRSFPAETNPETWTTLCSRTARLNLWRMWVPNAAWWRSAREAFNSYWWWADRSFPSVNSDAQVADIYLDASPRNAQYGHRAAAFRDGWQWFVLDPYFRIPWQSDRRAAIPAETYLNHMCGTLWRNFWWAHFPPTSWSPSWSWTMTS